MGFYVLEQEPQRENCFYMQLDSVLSSLNFYFIFSDLYRASIVRDLLLLNKTRYSHLFDKSICYRFDMVIEL